MRETSQESARVRPVEEKKDEIAINISCVFAICYNIPDFRVSLNENRYKFDISTQISIQLENHLITNYLAQHGNYIAVGFGNSNIGILISDSINFSESDSVSISHLHRSQFLIATRRRRNIVKRINYFDVLVRYRDRQICSTVKLLRHCSTFRTNMSWNRKIAANNDSAINRYAVIHARCFVRLFRRFIVPARRLRRVNTYKIASRISSFENIRVCYLQRTEIQMCRYFVAWAAEY